MALSPVSLPTKYCCPLRWSPQYQELLPGLTTIFSVDGPSYIYLLHISFPPTYCSSSNESSSSSISLKPCPTPLLLAVPPRTLPSPTDHFTPSFCIVTALVSHTFQIVTYLLRSLPIHSPLSKKIPFKVWIPLSSLSVKPLAALGGLRTSPRSSQETRPEALYPSLET